MVITLEAGSARRIYTDGLPLVADTGKPLDILDYGSVPASDRDRWLRLARSLRGQFVIVVTESDTAVVITDLTGCYPVFRLVAPDGTNWKFATSLAEAETDSRRNLRRTALMQYVAFGTMDVNHETIYSDVDRVPAGSVAFYARDCEKVTEYVEWGRIIAPEETNAEIAGEKLEADILSYTDASLNQEGDGRKLGILLSGGTDSSLLASILRTSYATRLSCFTQHFRFARYSEFAAAVENARSLGIKTSPVMLNRSNHHAAMLALNSALQDQPCGSVQTMNLWCLIHSVSNYCKTFMVGEHADSLFLGFGHFFSGFPSDSAGYTFATHALSTSQKMDWARPRIEASVLDSELLQVLNVSKSEYQEWANDFAKKRAARLAPFRESHLTKLQQLDGQIGGGLSWQRIVLPVQRSMDGVHVLTPFFDSAVIELALGLGVSLKYRDGKTKFLLRHVLQKHLGREVPKKPAAASPVAIWRLVMSMRERTQIAPWLRPYYDRVSRRNLMSAGRLANHHVKTAALGIWMGARNL